MLLFLKLKNQNKKWRRTKKKKDEETEQEKAKEKDKKSHVLKHLQGDLELLQGRIRVSQNAVKEGSTGFGEVMGKKLLDMNKLKMYQAQIAIGVKRKSEFRLEVGLVEETIKKAKE